MTRQFAAMLSRGAGVLFEQIEASPELANQLVIVAFLLQQLSADVDGHAAGCLKQANRIKAIFRKAAEIMPPVQRSKVEALIPTQPTTPEDYQTGHLDRYLSRLKIALIEVHAWLETAQAPGRQALLDEIWDFLERQATHESRLMVWML